MQKKGKKTKIINKWKITNPLRFRIMIARSLWYILSLGFAGIYCYNHWDSCLDFSPLDGNNAIFFILLFLLIFPLLPNLKVSLFGIELETKNEDIADMLDIANQVTAEAPIDMMMNDSAEAMKMQLETEVKSIREMDQGEVKHDRL